MPASFQVLAAFVLAAGRDLVLGMPAWLPHDQLSCAGILSMANAGKGTNGRYSPALCSDKLELTALLPGTLTENLACPPANSSSQWCPPLGWTASMWYSGEVRYCSRLLVAL